MDKEILDLNGKPIKVGDKVVIGRDLASGCDYLLTGIVKKLLQKNNSIKAIITIDHSGLWSYNKNTKIEKNDEVYTTANRTHNNILIIS